MLNGQELKECRILLDLTLEDIATLMCTTRQTISNIERETSNHLSMGLAFYNRIIDDIVKNGGRLIGILDGKEYYVREA